MALLSPQPSTLGRRRAAHLLRRTTFGPTCPEISQYAERTPADALTDLMKLTEAPSPPRDLRTGRPWLPAPRSGNSPNSRLRFYTVYHWIDHLCRAPLSMRERMVYFFHTHFTTIQSRAAFASALHYQQALFRHYALGNIKQLARKLCYDNAMLMHLDGRYNRVGKPNENYAREFLELFTIGKGEQRSADDYTTYTEQDVRAAARIFSGFQVDRDFAQLDPDTGLPTGIIATDAQGEAYYHDFEEKTFSDRFGGQTIRPNGRTPAAVDTEINEFVEMVFAQPATAQHLCRKLYRFFVYHRITPEIEYQVIRPLAEEMMRSGYELEPVLRLLLSSRHFYDISDQDDGVGGVLVKSPLELVTQMLRYFEVALPAERGLDDFYTLYGTIFYKMQEQGMQLYEPPEVAGYPAYHQGPSYNRNWVSATTLAYRYRFGEDLVGGIGRRDLTPELRLDVMDYVNHSGSISDPSDATQLVSDLIEDLFPRPVSASRLTYFVEEILLDGLPASHWASEWQDYERSRQDRGVRTQLEHLFAQLMQSPEYQLF